MTASEPQDLPGLSLEGLNSAQPLLDLETNRKLNPNLDDFLPVQSWGKSEDVLDLEGRLVQLGVTGALSDSPV